jgi:hypothetical protein
MLSILLFSIPLPVLLLIEVPVTVVVPLFSNPALRLLLIEPSVSVNDPVL